MQNHIVSRLSRITLIDLFVNQLQDTINMYTDGEQLNFSKFQITSVNSNEIHFRFNIYEKVFYCNITWQKFLANKALLNQKKFN